MPGKPKKAQPAAEDEKQGNVPVPAATQESPASGPPRITQDVEGNPVNILLDPVTGVPLEQAEQDE